MLTATLDLETSDLSAHGAGWILLACVKPLGGDTIVYRYDKFHCGQAKETKMLASILRKLAEFDVVIGHNIIKFDWNFLKSRALTLGLELPVKPVLYDTMEAFKSSGLLTIRNFKGNPSAALAQVVDFLDIPNTKTAILPRNHWKTVWGNRLERAKALDVLEYHCIEDVKMTEQVFRVLWKYDKGFVKFTRAKH